MLGEKTLRLMDELDGVVAEAGGVLYAAKDSRMTMTIMCQSGSRLGQWTNYTDGNFESGFLRRSDFTQFAGF